MTINVPVMHQGIRQEIKQGKPFSCLEEEAVVALARTADQLRRPLDALLKQHGLTATQYNVLRILRGAGSNGLACSEVGERMVSRDPDITRLLDRMERTGLCARTRAPQDRRVIVARITGKGLEAVGSLDEPIHKLNIKMLGHMGKVRLRSLLRLLDEVRHR